MEGVGVPGLPKATDVAGYVAWDAEVWGELVGLRVIGAL